MCAARLEFDGRTYNGGAPLERDPEVSGRTVEAVLPSCDDSGGQDDTDPATSVRAAELKDIGTDVAFLWNDAIFVRRGQQLPDWTKRWFRPVRCLDSKAFDLTGETEGVTGPPQLQDGPLEPPYQLDLHVTEAPDRYLGANISLAVTARTNPSLSEAQVDDAIGAAMKVTATVRCSRGSFEAVALGT